MSSIRILTFFLLIALVSVPFACSADPPEVSPSPPPELGADVSSPPSNLSPVTSPPASPSLSPSVNSPPAPPPSNLAPDSAPAPAPGDATERDEKSPAPAPAVASDISHRADSSDIEASESSGGMKAGQKAGVAIGVIAGLFVVGLGALVYKKRQQNIRRAEFGYAARRDML